MDIANYKFFQSMKTIYHRYYMEPHQYYLINIVLSEYDYNVFFVFKITLQLTRSFFLHNTN